MLETVLFSGALINKEALAQELELTSCSEEELLAQGFEQGGAAFVAKLNGRFAAVLYDGSRQRYYCFRDRFGSRGLYYRLAADGAPRFALRIQELRQGAAADSPADSAGSPADSFCEELLEVYLSYFYIPGENTAIRGIYKPLPGYCYCFDKDSLHKERYWTPRFCTENRSEAEWEEELAACLDEIFADAESGGAALLSSGVDSSYLCARLAPESSYTARYEQAEYSEDDLATEFSQSIGAAHHSVRISPEAYLDAVPATMRAFEQPSGDASAPALYLLCKEIATRSDSCYSGEGIDELFFGYSKDAALNCAQQGSLRDAGYFGKTFTLSEEEKARFLKHYAPSRKMDYVQEAYELSAEQPPLNQAALMDLLVWMDGNLLPNCYGIGSATGLELKTPYLDNRLYELSLRIPSELKQDGTQVKKIFRNVAARRLSRDIAYRAKRGFPLPIRSWMRSAEYLRRIKQAFSCDTAMRFFNREALISAYDEMLANPEDRESWRGLWSIYCFIVWYNECIDPRGALQRWQVYDQRFNQTEMWPKQDYPGRTLAYMREAGCLVCALSNLLVQQGMAPSDEALFNPLLFAEDLKRAGLFDEYADLQLEELHTHVPLRYIGRFLWDGGTQRPNKRLAGPDLLPAPPLLQGTSLLRQAQAAGFACLLEVPGAHDSFHYVMPSEIIGNDVRILDSGWDHEYLSDFSQCYAILLFLKTDRDDCLQKEELRLVDKTQLLPAGFQPQLTEVPSFPKMQASRLCVDALEQMLDACRKEGLIPCLISGYRSIAEQEQLVEESIQSRMQEGMSEAEARLDTADYVAQPGASEHHLGLSFDILSAENADMLASEEDAPLQRWLHAHCARFGFILRYPKGKEAVTGITYEPWHYRYVGRVHAALMAATGLTLEEYREWLQS